MAYRIAKGTVSIDGKSPDGDTISFTIDNQEEWTWPRTRDGRFPRFNMKYQANIRFEAIDALELHFTVQNVWPQIVVRQPVNLAKGARDRLLSLCGFDLSVIEEDDKFRISDPQQQKRPVTLAYNGIDPFGRIIGFLFVEEMGFEVSDRKPTVRLTPEQIARSINAKLLEEGMAYPTFYGSLYPELRDSLSGISIAARDDGHGIWRSHQQEFIFDRKPNIEELEQMVMMPKLFRRLSTHLARNGAISNFGSYLSENNDVTVDTRSVRLTNLRSFIRSNKIEDDKYQLYMNRMPEELVFVKT